jgi:hypothetical protein
MTHNGSAVLFVNVAERPEAVAGFRAFFADLYKGRRERMHGAVFAFPVQNFVSIMRFAVQFK